jgi:electron transfer flavoprotein beta subunit
VGPGIATRLNYSQLTLVDRIENVDLQARRVRVSRKLEGRHEVVETSLPAMIAVVREVNRPRYPTVPMRLMADDAQITLWNNKVLGLREDTIGLKGSATQVRRIFSPQRARGEILGDGVSNSQEAANLLVDRLIEKGLLVCDGYGVE